MHVGAFTSDETSIYFDGTSVYMKCYLHLMCLKI